MKITNDDAIQIFYDRIGDNRYMAFDLFIYPTYKILKDIHLNTTFINNFNHLKKQNTILVMYLNDLDKYVSKYGYNVSSNLKIIFIHADYIFNHSIKDQNQNYKFLNVNKNSSWVWEYSSQNIFYYNQNFKYIKYYFLPLLYDEDIEVFYKSKLINGKIPWEKKDIDIVFLGDYSERRKNFFENIKNKYNTYIITNNNNYKEMINIIERGKIFVNIFSKENNKAFDYFRLTLLYSNNVFVITETPKVSFKIENNLVDLKDIIITSNYDNMENTINKYICLSSEYINNITEKTYNEIKKYTLKQSILNFF
jgi:hypothetical protein